MKTSITLNEIQTEAVDDSVVLFSEPLYIVGTRARQWNGTIYDLKTTDISQWDGTITADHSDKLQDVIGKAVNLQKREDGITISGIKYAIKENPLAVLAKNLLLGGFATGFSCETIGPDPDEEGVWHNHSLCGLSQVSHPNDKLAYAVISNSREEARKLGWEDKKVNDTFNAYVVEKADEEDKVKNKLEEKERYDAKDFCPYEFAKSVMEGPVLALETETVKKAIFENEAEIVPREGFGVETALLLNELEQMSNMYYAKYEEKSTLSPLAEELLEEQKGYYVVFRIRALEAINQTNEWADEDYERIRKAIIPLTESHVEYLKKEAQENKLPVPDYDSLLSGLRDLTAPELRKDAEQTKLENRAIVFKDVTEEDGRIVKAKVSIVSRKADKE